MDDPQLEVVEAVAEVEAPLTEDNADTVAASEETHDKPIFSPAQKAAATSAFRERETRRENKELQQQLDDLKNTKAEQATPVVKDIDEYSTPEEVAEYRKQVTVQAEFNAEQKAVAKQQQNTAYQANLDAQKEQADLRQTFVDNSTKQGIKVEDLQTAANLVDSYGLNPEITQAILGDKDGGLTLIHLSTNPQAINELNGASVLTLGSIYSAIQEASAALKPKTSSAPPPAEKLSGVGSTLEKHPALEGVIYS